MVNTYSGHKFPHTELSITEIITRDIREGKNNEMVRRIIVHLGTL